MAKLTAVGVRSLRQVGKYADGDGLLLDVRAPDRRYWTYRYQRAGRVRWMSLGEASDVSLAEARAARDEARRLIRQGLDPLDERDRVKLDLSRSFAQVAEACIAAKAPGWRHGRTAGQWRNMLRDYVTPHFGKLPIAEIGVAQVLKVLSPLWVAKPDVARRLRVRLEAVFDYAIALAWHPGPNPAVWRGGLKPLLAAKSKLPSAHYAALDWHEVPALMAALAADESVAARCLAFLIMTASRSGEARGAAWAEIDPVARLWSLPAGRMKAGRDHRVPLSEPVLALLSGLRGLSSRWVFPGHYAGRLMSDVTLKAVLHRHGYGAVTVHGFRSTFRDWAADTGKPADLAEQALAHVVGSAVERSYRRTDVLERRRALMAEWAEFLTAPPAQVLPFRAA
jgi:integrase